MQLDRAIEYYLSAKRAENRTEATITTYSSALYTFARLMTDVVDTEEIDHLVVREFIIRLQDRGVADTTVTNRVRHLKAFCAWLAGEELLRVSPFAPGRDGKPRVKVPVFEQRDVDTVTDEEFRRLLEQCDPKTDIGRRDIAMLMLLFDTGVRVSELVGLRVEDVDLQARIAKVKGKGRKHRHVFLSPQTALAVTRYLARRKDPVRDGEYLLTGKKHNFDGKLQANGVRFRLRALARKAGVDPKRVHPHAFRHTMATNYLRMGGDPASLQRMLGHADVTTTVKNYVHLVTEDLQRKHDEFGSMGRVLSRR